MIHTPIAALLPLENVGEVIRTVLLALIGFVVLLHVVGPLAILVGMRFEATPKAVRFDLGDYGWPVETNELFEEASGALERCGFEVSEGFFLPSTVPGVKAAGVLMVNREQRDSAIIVAMYALTVTTFSLKTLYVEFSTVGTDGHVYDTNNSGQLSAFPTPKGKTVSQLPKVRDTATLYEIHRAIMQRDRVKTSDKLFTLDKEFGGDGIEWIQAGMKSEFMDAAADGYLTRFSTTHYRPTLIGAFLMAWKELWPAKMIRRHWRSRAAIELLDDLRRQGVELTQA